MQIAITGGSGRIGQAVVTRALADQHRVVCIDQRPPATIHHNLTFIQADIGNYVELEAALLGCDALVHLAAIPSPHGIAEHIVHNTNVVGSYNALAAAAALGIKRICQASSINATGAAYSRSPRFDYFPLDEQHPTYNEDAYSLSKWICEQQADSIVRRYSGMVISSMRFHWIVPDRATAQAGEERLGSLLAKHLWGYTLLSTAANAILRSLVADIQGHQVFQIVEPETMMSARSSELAQQYFPAVPFRRELHDHQGFFDCSKAATLLGIGDL